ncbi:RbsD/FucU family protein [Nitratireductor kimnyeongensis]|uniref:RbsD/FucU family protein n=1 Tax=Nitratireductor kimnyeongensis TaxID=430679 RepID=A0ABW0TCP1_9HYPH|nr:RbsD/FucU domain-containing protein [Nitratireductor kimnyeongensis]QZZ37603.1 ribose ABC transporter [Nitratireductor kimnyeongensis]
MLRGIDPILSPELLRILRAMGHGDEIVIADANFPGEASAREFVRLDGIDATRVLKAVLSVMPLDSFVDDPAITMQMVDDPDGIPPVVAEFQAVINKIADNPAEIRPLERFAFYDRAREAFAVIQTGERRFYGNVILKKGVLPPEQG